MPVFADVEEGHAVDEDTEEDDADEGSPDSACAAHEIGAADDDGGDDVELPAGAAAVGAGHILGGLHDAGDDGEGGDDDHDADFYAGDMNAAESCGFGVSADGVDGTTEGCVVHDELNKQERGDENNRWEGNLPDVARADEVKPVGEWGEGEAVGDEAGGAAEDGEPGESADKGGDAEADAEDAGDCADCGARRSMTRRRPRESRGAWANASGRW